MPPCGKMAVPVGSNGFSRRLPEVATLRNGNSSMKTWSILLAASLLSADPDAPPVIPLWADGAPGFEARRAEPEVAKDYWVRNIHNPSVTAYLPPADRATGAAVVVCPGG